MYFTYALHNKEKDKIYIGYTSNLEKRILRHNGILRNKKNSFTSKQKGEWIIIYKEEFVSRKLAIKREKELKSYRGRIFIRKNIDNSGA